MPLRLAILGLETSQPQWLHAVQTLRASHEVEVVGIAHQNLASARDVAAAFKAAAETAAAIPVFDDLRQLLKDAAPQVVVMDRPATTTIDFLIACASQEIGIFSLGPPVDSLFEAQALSGVLEPRTRLLYIWPRFADAPASTHCAQADEFVRPIRFASATWLGINYALAKAMGTGRLGHSAVSEKNLPVRSMSVLAWDALGTLVRLMGVPLSVYAAIRGTSGAGNSFADISGAASVTLRFSDDAAASLTLCDRAPAAATTHGGLGAWNRRDLMLWGAGGTLKLNADAYEFRDADGELVDTGPPSVDPSAGRSGSENASALHDLRTFLEQYSLPPSPHRGWTHHLEEIAATLEALVVSQRTGQPESPDRLRQLRR